MKFSIILTSYRQPKYLLEAINSVFIQTYQNNFQLIIIDDSGNNPDFIKIKNDTRIDTKYIVNKENLGLQKSYNLGCYYATGDWIVRLDGDDKFFSFTLQKLSDFIDKQIDPKLAFIYSDLRIMESEKIKFYPEWDGTLLGLQKIGHLQATKKIVSEKLNHWDVSLKYSADTDYIIRLLELGMRIKHTPEVLYYNRLHSEQYTQIFPKNNDPQFWKNKIFKRTMDKRPELWPESIQKIVLDTTGSYYWKSEIIAIDKYCRGNGLDLGCANRKKIPWCIGVDTTREGGKVPEFIWDIQKPLPFKDETFDFIVGCHVLEHIQDPVVNILQWLKLVKIGGYLVLIIPDKTYIPNIGTTGSDPTHLHDWNPETFEKEVLCSILTRQLPKVKIVKYGVIGNQWSFIMVLQVQ